MTTGAMPGSLGACPLPRMDHTEVQLAHGAGGRLMADLIDRLFVPAFRNSFLERLDDQAVVDIHGAKLAFTTDSYVVTPLFFPGGDIGCLAVNGTVNDLAMCGARPLYLSAGFIVEEGCSFEELQRVVASMSAACVRAGVLMVTGDTKVVNRGSADKLFINTSGVGVLETPLTISADQARPGDRVVVSGTIADHGMAVMAMRTELQLDSVIESDTAPLHSLVRTMVAASSEVHCLRDPTRGGLATCLNEIARRSRVGIVLNEAAVPIRDDVKGLCEILGLDPLYVANEGKLVAIVGSADAERVVLEMRDHPHGTQARIIGEVVADHPEHVVMRTGIGGTRVVGMLVGDQLPRIC